MSHSEKPVKTWPAALNLDTLVANTGGTLHEFDLDRAKLTSGGWELPSLDGTAHCGALTGVIVYWRDCRARWEGELGGVPVCYSKEAKIGTGIPGGDCASCEYAQFGSDAAGRGQACKLMRQLLVLLQGELLPKVATLPPTSISPCRKYFLRLASVGKPIWSVVTELATTTAKNAHFQSST